MKIFKPYGENQVDVEYSSCRVGEEKWMKMTFELQERDEKTKFT